MVATWVAMVDAASAGRTSLSAKPPATPRARTVAPPRGTLRRRPCLLRCRWRPSIGAVRPQLLETGGEIAEHRAGVLRPSFAAKRCARADNGDRQHGAGGFSMSACARRGTRSPPWCRCCCPTRGASAATIRRPWPDLNTSILQSVDCVDVSAKFRSAWHYAPGGRGVFGRVWVGRSAGGGLGGRAAAARHGRA